MKASQPVTRLSSDRDVEVSRIVSTANRLREVRKASRQFLLLWNLERGHVDQTFPGPDSSPALSDPANHDWSLLYQGSVLDD